MSALAWGTGDFAGGLASRYGSVALAMLVSQSVGVLATGIILAASGEPPAAASSFAWAALAGLAGIGGLACFYRALAGGTMALIAPLAGVIGAALPAAVAVMGGEQLSNPRVIGLAVALAAILFIALPKGVVAGKARVWHVTRAELALAGGAGLGFAGFFLFLDRATIDGSTWWPLFTVRLAGLGTLVVALAVILARRSGALHDRTRRLLGLHRLSAAVSAGVLGIVPVFVLAGAGDLGGNVFFLFANQHDALAVAVVLSSLYPVITALLAALLLGERLGRPQLAGVGLAALAAALIGAG